MAAARTATEKALDGLAERLAGCKSLRSGSVAFVLPGEKGGDYRLDCQPGSVRVEKGVTQRTHQVEVIGTAANIRSLVSGEHDARKLFLTGGFRLRGDLRYASDVAVELGIIKDPL
jgi:hypothetical protein